MNENDDIGGTTMTPCEKLGYKVGDKFEVINNSGMSCQFDIGDIIELYEDDGSGSPLWKGGRDYYKCCDGENGAYLKLDKVEKLPQVNISANEWPDSPPGKIEHLEEVHHPQHYTDGGVECIDAIKAALSPEEYKGFLKGNAMKYIWRMNRKGKPSVDAKKALWYTDKLCGELE